MIPTQTIHNPDRYMADLRQMLSQGRKRIGMFLGAGAPTAIQVDGSALIPDVNRLTIAVLADLGAADLTTIRAITSHLASPPNIEVILTQVRRLAQAIGSASVHGLDGPQFEILAQRICTSIGKHVAPTLPDGTNPYTELVSWVGGTHREHPVEIFTPNYDLLLEEAFERARLPYFDGFTGAVRPFFDPSSISSDDLPRRWSRIWKLHGSLGWELHDETVIRTGSRSATTLIYPDHLKYDAIREQPYSALFERLRHFLMTPDSLLLCSGFSFSDSHICAVLHNALRANAHTAVIAFQYGALEQEAAAIRLAVTHPNLSVYARDGAVVSGISGAWQLGQSPNEDWKEIRQTFWRSKATENTSEFTLGDFSSLARFIALAQSLQLHSSSAAAPPGDVSCPPEAQMEPPSA